VAGCPGLLGPRGPPGPPIPPGCGCPIRVDKDGCKSHGECGAGQLCCYDGGINVCQ